MTGFYNRGFRMAKAPKVEGKTAVAAHDDAPSDYAPWLVHLKKNIAEARLRAAVAANAQMVMVYWEIGRGILVRQSSQGWGSKVIERLSEDLRVAYPEMTGFSVRNLRYMRSFAEAWPDAQIVQTLSAQLTWSHQVMLLDKVKDSGQRTWYAQQCVKNGWKLSVLGHQIDTKLIDRSGTAVTNFARTLPPPDSELAQQLTKDPHIFDFLGLGDEFAEKELEDAMVSDIQRFMLELGKGFAFVGRQFELIVGGDEFFIDLLFYNYLLHRFVVVELKVDDFKPEYAGKLLFYMTAVDRQVKSTVEGETIGILLCRSHNKVVAEYALAGMPQPMGVSGYSVLPPALRDALPSVEQLETAIALSGVAVAEATMTGNLTVGPPAGGTSDAG
jgi:predicted nuclease of restriction endonuclease-like (RecB) superfamily